MGATRELKQLCLVRTEVYFFAVFQFSEHQREEARCEVLWVRARLKEESKEIDGGAGDWAVKAVERSACRKRICRAVVAGSGYWKLSRYLHSLSFLKFGLWGL